MEKRLIRQYGVIPYRRGADGAIEVMLVTSRETRRWVIPRGNPISGLTGQQSAAREAFEEAGVEGALADAIGSYAYDKRKASGIVPAEVTVYPMAVSSVLDNWPERHERERRWFAPEDAAAAVDEAGLSALVIKVKQLLLAR